ncbi:heavy metal sensor histidine kinase [Roseateles sp.]|uniref:heavy metal sensor histidine kinase n=1 Tax=Roseateles sp. TaxID=1971397 RepID=UPI003BACA8F3
MTPPSPAPGALGATSLRGRLSRLFALQTMVGLGGVCAVVYVVIALTLAHRQDELLAHKRVAVERLLNEGGAVHDLASIRHLLSDFMAGHDELSLAVRQPGRAPVFERNVGRRMAPLHKGVGFPVTLSAAVGGPGWVELGYDTSNDEQLLSRLFWTLLTTALVGTLAVSASGFVLVKKGLAPLNALARQTATLDARHLDQRLDLAGQSEEIQPLLVQFNALLDRLQVAYQHMEAFNADVAHELNNPLSILIGSCDVALRRPRSAAELHEVLSSNLEELRRIAVIVADMLFLSNAERGASARRAPPASMARLVAEVVDYHDAVLAESQLTVRVLGDAQAAVDTGLVRRAVSNLLGNAARYALQGSRVEVRIGRADPRHVSIGVHNRGPVIAAAHLPRLFDRFYRIDPSRTNADRNHGLGLAIVAAIAKMHGGTASARSSQSGTLVQFTLQMWESSPDGAFGASDTAAAEPPGR